MFPLLYAYTDVNYVANQHALELADYPRTADRRTDHFARLRSRVRLLRLLWQRSHAVRRLSQLQAGQVRQMFYTYT